MMLTPATLPDVQEALGELQLDAWLLYDFRGCNPVAASLLGLAGLQTRRVFGHIPREGVPTAVTHNIEQGPWAHWPNEWRRERYSAWSALESLVACLVRGKRVAMEYSPGDAVPVLDRVPAGVVEMVRNAGAGIVSSGDLVSRFYATLSDAQVVAHVRTAETLAQIARGAIALAGERARGGSPLAEHELHAWILGAFERAGLETTHGPDVAVGANAADPHYAPSAERPQLIALGSVLLVDLWAREPGNPYADQCWMASLGTPNERTLDLWTAVRDARDAAIAFVRQAAARGERPRGAAVDDVARDVLRRRGLADAFTHRTGHSLDARDVHGAGPNLDNLETREERLLIPGVAFSIEPGVYFPGEIGLRSEVNAIMGAGDVRITPNEYQRDLILV
ncbi:MAG: M24 family metallopeptidase [Gemmatimonadaceae bacterium]